MGSGWGIVILILPILHVLYLAGMHFRLKEADSMLVAASDVCKQYKLLRVALLASFVSAGWIMLWVWVFIGISGRLTVYVDIVLFLLLLWFAQIIKYMAHTTIAGVTATWYYGKRPYHPIRKAAARVFSTSFGSIALGALLVGISRGFAVTAAYFRTSTNIIAQVFAVFVLMLDQLLGTFNVYGFCYIAIYGKPYLDACKTAFEVTMTNGLRPIMVDDLISGASIALSFTVGILCAGAGWVLTKIMVDYDGSKVVTVYLVSFFIGFTTGIVILDVFESIGKYCSRTTGVIHCAYEAHKETREFRDRVYRNQSTDHPLGPHSLYACVCVATTIYIGFAEEPDMLEERKKFLYRALLDAWFSKERDEEGSDGEASETEDDTDSISSVRTSELASEDGDYANGV